MAAYKGFYKYYEGLPPWGKAVTLLGIGAAAYFLYQKISASVTVKKTLKEERETLNTAQNDIKKLENDGVRQSYSDAQYKVWADVAYACYAGWGTCTGDTIFVNLKNDVDVLKLIQAFGIRTIPSGRFNPAPDFTGTLPQVMRDELTLGQIKSINDLLAKKGITYKF